MANALNIEVAVGEPPREEHPLRSLPVGTIFTETVGCRDRLFRGEDVSVFYLTAEKRQRGCQIDIGVLRLKSLSGRFSIGAVEYRTENFLVAPVDATLTLSRPE